MNAKAVQTKAEPTIRLVPANRKSEYSDHYIDRGRKAIIVDDVEWGYIYMEPHGVHGSSFWFEQKGTSGAITRPDRLAKDGERKRAVTEWSDKHYRLDKARPAPLADRLMNHVRAMIAEGLLRHPDDVKAEQKKAAEAFAAKRAKADADEEACLRVRAAVCLKPIEDHIGENMKSDMIANIVRAMKWAQQR